MKGRLKILIALFLAVAMLGVSVYLYASVIPNQIKKQERQALVEQYYRNKLTTYAIENEQYEDYEVDVAFLGDSLTDGYDLKKYYPEFVTANRGIGGETTIGLEQRLDISAIDLKPKVVVMLIGGNNFDTMLSNYERILIKLKNGLPESKIVLLSLTAMGWDWANQIAKENNIEISRLAEKYNFTFIDLFTPLLDPTTNKVYDGYTADGAHFTSTGYEVVTSLVKPTLIELLNK